MTRMIAWTLSWTVKDIHVATLGCAIVKRMGGRIRIAVLASVRLGAVRKARISHRMCYQLLLKRSMCYQLLRSRWKLSHMSCRMYRKILTSLSQNLSQNLKKLNLNHYLKCQSLSQNLRSQWSLRNLHVRMMICVCSLSGRMMSINVLGMNHSAQKEPKSNNP